MMIASLASVGPVRAAELALSARNETARAHSDARTVSVEVIRPVEPSSTPVSDAAAATERLRINISV